LSSSTPTLERNLRFNSNIVDVIAFVIALIGMTVLMLTAGSLPEGYPEVEVYSTGWYTGFVLLIVATILFWTSHFYHKVDYAPGP
jgi:amino acid permease